MIVRMKMAKEYWRVEEHSFQVFRDIIIKDITDIYFFRNKEKALSERIHFLDTVKHGTVDITQVSFEDLKKELTVEKFEKFFGVEFEEPEEE